MHKQTHLDQSEARTSHVTRDITHWLPDKITCDTQGCSAAVSLVILFKMYFKPLTKVLTILCVLVSLSRAQQTDAENAACDFKQDFDNLVLNCSRRGIEEIPEKWPDQVNDIDKDRHLLITFFNNTISNISQVPAVAGKRVAISFKSNEVVDIEDNAFRNVQDLVYLDLSDNYITGDVLRSEIFQGQYENGVYSSISLETLNLGHNDIHSLDRYLFYYTPNLTRLYLNHNPIEILDHVTILALSTAVNLEVLDLAKTDIDSIPLDAFKDMNNLQQIDLSDNRFVTVPESLSLVGESLQYLTFNNNPIVELTDDSFIGLKNLIELEVGENDYLDEVKRSTFSPLKSLRVLHLCHNKNLRYISHNAFRGLKDNWTLKEVYLDDNNLSELSTDLMPWSKLDILGMTGNNWLCNCDLDDIVNTKGAGNKFKPGQIPYCSAPMKLNGAQLTNMSVPYCPSLSIYTISSKSHFHLTLKPGHIIWSIAGVAAIAGFGMLLGLIVNKIKKVYHKRGGPVRYVNLQHA